MYIIINILLLFHYYFVFIICLQCFDTVGPIGIRKSIQSVKNLVMMCWLGVRCKRFAYDAADATATPSSRFVKIHTGLTFLVPAYRDCPGKEAIKQVSVIYLFSIIIMEVLITGCMCWGQKDGC